MARILLVGTDPALQARLEELLPGHRVVAHEGIEPPDLVIADVGRLDAADVADAYPDVPLLGVTSEGDTAGLRLAQAAGFDDVVARSALVERPQERISALLATAD